MKTTGSLNDMKKRLVAKGAYTVDDLVMLWNCDPDDVRRFLFSSEKNGYLFILTNDAGEAIVPAFFFDSHMCLRTELYDLMRPMRLAGFSTWRQWAWLVSPDKATLGGLTPQAAVDNKATRSKAILAAQSVATSASTAPSSAVPVVTTGSLPSLRTLATA